MDILQKIIHDTTTRYQDTWRKFHIDRAFEESRGASGARIPLIPALLEEALSYQGMYVIAEIKQASPSQGIICSPFHPLEIAKTYVEAEVDAISVLCEETFFLGSTTHLQQVREYTATTPLLRKDFIVHPYQVHEAYINGADIVLLIVAALQDDMLAFLYENIEAYGMTALVEVHTEEELARALRISPKLIGINNRNLKTFEVNLQTSISLRANVSKDIKVISESGIYSGLDVAMLQNHGIDGILVGQSILESEDSGSLISNLKYAR